MNTRLIASSALASVLAMGVLSTANAAEANLNAWQRRTKFSTTL